ncbi:predicted protein [Paecilomyces variotii No. 5]|uniref:ORC1/DEAH AAA+ ATPase domain-containing protein n=1 Tax=Byssochlamys spectabilis (strain No. 5 / NBRC 109023) TaxID=1356009 RepID=V5GAH9_BYSSN|nr:predicted protein [Paecilomyces variotii No. 5]
MAGRCTFEFTSGTVAVQCPCMYATFSSLKPGEGEQNCETCLHLLSSHKKDPSDRSISPVENVQENGLVFDRKDTVAALWTRIKERRAVHVKGTPSSGKTTLSKLLVQYVQGRKPGTRIHLITWPQENRDWSTADPYHKLLNNLTGLPEKETKGPPHDRYQTWYNPWYTMRALLVIDEAQRSYQYRSLWNDLIKNMHIHPRLHIALFSSYGSPTYLPVQTSTPVELSPRQQISIRRSGDGSDIGLFYSRDEFDHAVHMRCKFESEYRKLFLLSPELIEYMWAFTLGQPAILNDLLDALTQLEHAHTLRKEQRMITLDIGLELLNDEDRFLSLIWSGKSGFCRSLPKRTQLQENPTVTRFLRELLVTNRSKDNVDCNDALRECYQRGWVHAEEVEGDKPVYVIPSPAHRRYLECMLSMEAPEFPLSEYPSVKDLCFAAIRRFSPHALRCPDRGLSIAGNPRPLEAQYQDEFYRACYSLLGNNIHLSSEWTGKQVGGRVDFLVKSVGWAIECLRDGDKIEEHISRFSEGGRYHKWIQSSEIKQYIILDFRTSIPQKPRDDDNFYSVVFKEDYAAYDIYCSKGRRVEQDISLLRQ